MPSDEGQCERLLCVAQTLNQTAEFAAVDIKMTEQSSIRIAEANMDQTDFGSFYNGTACGNQ